MRLPLALNHEIVVQEMHDELMIYNLQTNQAYCLNKTSAIVFNACDNQQTFADLRAKHNLDEDLIYLALDELKRNNLLDANSEYTSPLVGINRRQLVKKIGLSTMIALPIVSTLIAPKAVSAQSIGLGAACSPATPCPSGLNCNLNTNSFPNTNICCRNNGTGPSGFQYNGGSCYGQDLCSDSLHQDFCCSGATTFTAGTNRLGATCPPSNTGVPTGLCACQ